MENSKLLGALEAKLESLHEDIRDLKVEVVQLKEDFIQRRAIYKAALYVLGGLSAVVGWIMNHIINRSGLS